MQRPLLAATFLLPLCLALPARPALAQAKASSNEIDLYGGRLFGQALTTTPPFDGSAMLPRLADDQTYGVRITHTFTKDFGIELGAGQTQTHTMRHAPPGSPDLRLRLGELDVTYNFTPDSPVVGYTLLGGGYAKARLQPELTGTFNGQPARLAGRGTPTGNIGIGARAYVTRHLTFRAEVRYRYFEHLVTDTADNARHLSTFETTVGLGWRF